MWRGGGAMSFVFAFSVNFQFFISAFDIAGIDEAESLIMLISQCRLRGNWKFTEMAPRRVITTVIRHTAAAQLLANDD